MEDSSREPFRDGEAFVQAATRLKLGVVVTALVDGTLRCLYASDVASDILGYTRDELLALPVLQLVPPEMREEVKHESEARRRDPSVLPAVNESVALRKDGQRITVARSSSDITFDGRSAVVTLFWDISAQKRAEATIRERELNFRTLVEGAPDAIVISRRGAILYANPAAARMLGVAPAARLVGRSLNEFLTPEDAALMRQRVEAIARTGVSLPPQEYQAVRPDGTRVTAEITSLPIEYEGVPAVFGIARDVTERVRLRETLVRTDRLAALGTLAAGIAHEINTPLAAILLDTGSLEQLIERALPTGTQRDEALGRIEDLRRCAEHVTRIVRDLRTFARNDPAERGPVNLHDVIQSAMRITGPALRDVDPVTVECEEHAMVLGSAGLLEQVFVNLLLNAAHAVTGTGRPSRIGVRVRCLEDGRVRADVSDGGIGIAPEVLSHIFDPFFTTKALGDGMGLGLFISHGIVTRLGGELTAESELGRGSTFTLVLPGAASSKPESAALPSRATNTVPALPTVASTPRVPAEAPKSRAKILLIDDDPRLLVALEYSLRDRYEVTTAGSGEEALAKLHDGHEFDLVLCDLMMPNVSGMDLHERLVATRPELAERVVFMTGGAYTPRAREFLSRVPNLLLEKPFRAAEVDALLETARAKA